MLFSSVSAYYSKEYTHVLRMCMHTTRVASLYSYAYNKYSIGTRVSSTRLVGV